MRVDPQGSIGGQPALRVRRFLRSVGDTLFWDSTLVAAHFSLREGQARDLVSALQRAGLIEPARGIGGRGWVISQKGQSFAGAKAAKPITRQTAENALREFMVRVQRVNEDRYFLAKVTGVVLFGSMLRVDVDRLGDVDIGIDLRAKEPNWERLQELNAQRVQEYECQGRRISGLLSRSFWWRLEVLRFLKGRSRSISLHDYDFESRLIDAVPHRWLLGGPPQKYDGPPVVSSPAPRARRPKGCPF
ncbi:MAG: hypothetical protein WB676_17455 [Bryobacteraceae bacterium]